LKAVKCLCSVVSPKEGLDRFSAPRWQRFASTSFKKIEVGEIDIAILKSAGVIRHDAIRAKVIASGSIERAVVLRGISVTRGARAAIEQAGGKVEA
jgi:large subunit ribosomal protein L15